MASAAQQVLRVGIRRQNEFRNVNWRVTRSASQQQRPTRRARLSVFAVSAAPSNKQGFWGLWGNKDSKKSSARTVDQRTLTMHPNMEVGPGAVKELFGYPRNVDSRYKYKERLGKGSFGVVSKVVDRETGEEYACKSLAKIPPSKNVATGRHLLKIWNEIDCLKLLGRSLDAVSLLDVFEDDKYVHFIMELCPGGQLLEMLNRVDRVSEDKALTLMRSVMRFVAQCHSKNIIYRDVNPVNFLFTSDGRLQATDFGLAVRHAPDDPPIIVRAGTPVYMSPEAVGRNYSTKADVWSAGILCYQLLAGRYPYWDSSKIPPETSLNQLFDVIATHDIDYQVFTELGVSSTAVDLLRKMLTKDPKRRISAAKALQHPWFTETADEDCCFSDLECSFVQRLQHFAGNAHFRQYVLNHIADNVIFGSGGELLSKNERASQLEPLVRMFQRLDKDDSGELGSSDLLADLHDEGYILTDSEMNKLLCSIRDNENNERIMLDEFCARLLDWSFFQRHRSWRALLRSAFDDIDVDDDGVISVADITEVFTSSAKSLPQRHAQAQDILREFSTSAVTAGITWNAFCGLFTEYDLSIGSLSHFDRRYISDSSICDATYDV